MKKNLIHVIYPAEYLASFVIEGNHTDNDLLEMVFARWNHGSGMESEQFISSKKRSMSVNDIVCVNGKYFQCASFGWNEVTTEFVNKLEESVENHPFCDVHGPWFALNEVMYNRNKNLVVA